MSEVSVAQAGQEQATQEVAQAETQGRPVGKRAFVRWVAPLLHAGKTLDELVAAYPTEITKNSFSAKLSDARKWCREHNIDLPQAKRAGRESNDDIDAKELAKELNLRLILQDDGEQTESAKESE